MKHTTSWQMLYVPTVLPLLSPQGRLSQSCVLWTLGSGSVGSTITSMALIQPDAASLLLSITLTAGLSMSPLWGLFFFPPQS